MAVSTGAQPVRAKAMAVSIGTRPARTKATPVSRERFQMPVGGGGAWPGFEPTLSHTSAPQAPLVWRAPEGTEGTGGLRDRSLRAKLVCGDLAGGPPPTGATGRIKWAGLASPGSVVAKISRGSEVAKVPSEARGADGERAGRPRAAWKYGGEAAERKRGRRDSASGGVEVEEGY